jgi:hypothetical protein
VTSSPSAASKGGKSVEHATVPECLTKQLTGSLYSTPEVVSARPVTAALTPASRRKPRPP